MLRLFFSPSPFLGEPFDDKVSEKCNGGSDDDRADEHGGVNIPTLLQNLPQPCMIQRQRMPHRENQLPQSIFSEPDEWQKRNIENRRDCTGDSSYYVPLQQPRHRGRHDDWGWIQRQKTGKDADGEASRNLVRPGIEVLQLLPNLSDSFFQGDSAHDSERLAGMRHITGDVTVTHVYQPPRPLHD